MDPAIKAFLDKLDAALDANTAATKATNAKINDLISWRPDLERRVADLGDAVAALQQAQPPASTEGATSKVVPDQPQQPAMLGASLGAAAGAAGISYGSTDHGGELLQRGPPVASFATPPPPPANGQIEPHTPFTLPSPFMHASQLLTGLGQAHPSIIFPVFTGENP